MNLDKKLAYESFLIDTTPTPELAASLVSSGKVKPGLTFVGVAATGRAHYFRCNDCLTPVTVPGDAVTGDLVCGCGGESFEYLGRVSGYTWVRTEAICNCDGRCTQAIGPHCDCFCGGKNHGAGLAAWTEKVVDTGRVRFNARVSEAAAELGRIYREFIRNAERARINAYINADMNGPLFALKKCKTHKARVKYYEKITARLNSFAKTA
jgi:hypothetical protein